MFTGDDRVRKRCAGRAGTAATVRIDDDYDCPLRNNGGEVAREERPRNLAGCVRRVHAAAVIGGIGNEVAVLNGRLGIAPVYSAALTRIVVLDIAIDKLR